MNKKNKAWPKRGMALEAADPGTAKARGAVLG